MSALGKSHSHQESIDQTYNRIKNLITELDVIVVNKATLNDQNPVRARDTCLCEEGGEDVTKKTTNAVVLNNLHEV